MYGHFIDVGNFPIEIPIEVEKSTHMGRKGLRAKNKNSSEICGQIVTFWEHAYFQILNFIKIRIPHNHPIKLYIVVQ